MIDWKNPQDKISKYFNVHDAIWLPSWQTYHLPTEEEQKNILEMAKKMDTVREFLNLPVNVHCWIRPEKYNKEIGGAPGSAHILGKAVDWDCGKNCDDVRQALLIKIPFWKLRMEDAPKTNWVHLGNDWQLGKKYFFRP